jgi:nuclear protein localization protein 4 homolog
VQTSNDLKVHLSRHSSKKDAERLADFHLLLWLAKSLHWQDSDLALVVDAVKHGLPLMEGYKMMIDSMAGL